jgi:hypothetical protein
MGFEYIIDKVFSNPVFVITVALLIAVKFCCDAYVRTRVTDEDVEPEFSDSVAQRIKAISDDEEMLSDTKKELIIKVLDGQ